MKSKSGSEIKRKKGFRIHFSANRLRIIICLALLSFSSLQAQIESTNQPSGDSKKDTSVKTGYAPVNGLKLYYEIRGSGDPLILLHGGIGSIEMFGTNLSALAEKSQVIAVDLQGHGRTGDIDRPLSYESMADDIAALIKYFKLEKADIMGYSLGGGVALQTTIRHPEIVRKLIVVSTPFKRDGWYPEVLAGMSQMGPVSAENMKQSPVYQQYVKLAPKPEDWSVLITKLGEMLKKDYDWSRDVKAIKIPVFIIAGDADAVRTSHTVEFFGLLGGGLRDADWDGSLRPKSELAILPGLIHYNIFMSPALAETVIPFLQSGK